MNAGALATVARLLAPGGLLVLGTPNEGACWWQLAYKRAPDVRATTDHVHFYTADTLVAKVKLSLGFKSLRSNIWVGGRRTGAWMDAFANTKFWMTYSRFWVADLFPRQASSLYLIAQNANHVMSTNKQTSGGIDVRRANQIDGVYRVHTICRKMDSVVRANMPTNCFPRSSKPLKAFGSWAIGRSLLRHRRPSSAALPCPTAGASASTSVFRTLKRLQTEGPKEAGLANVAFAVADAPSTTARDHMSVGTLYSLSALYQVPDNDARPFGA